MSTMYKELTFTIANNSDTSDMQQIPGEGYNRGQMALCRVQCPATMTTATANIQFSEDNSRYDDLYNTSGTKLTFSAVQSTSVALSPAEYSLPAPYMKIKLAVANTSGSAIVFKAWARAV